MLFDPRRFGLRVGVHGLLRRLVEGSGRVGVRLGFRVCADVRLIAVELLAAVGVAWRVDRHRCIRRRIDFRVGARVGLRGRRPEGVVFRGCRGFRLGVGRRSLGLRVERGRVEPAVCRRGHFRLDVGRLVADGERRLLRRVRALEHRREGVALRRRDRLIVVLLVQTAPAIILFLFGEQLTFGGALLEIRGDLLGKQRRIAAVARLLRVAAEPA